MAHFVPVLACPPVCTSPNTIPFGEHTAFSMFLDSLGVANRTALYLDVTIMSPLLALAIACAVGGLAIPKSEHRKPAGDASGVAETRLAPEFHADSRARRGVPQRRLALRPSFT
jgi:hypothetical protein